MNSMATESIWKQQKLKITKVLYKLCEKPDILQIVIKSDIK